MYVSYSGIRLILAHCPARTVGPTYLKRNSNSWSASSLQISNDTSRENHTSTTTTPLRQPVCLPQPKRTWRARSMSTTAATTRHRKRRRAGSQEVRIALFRLLYDPSRSHCFVPARYRVSTATIKGLAVSPQKLFAARRSRELIDIEPQTNSHAENSTTALLRRRSNICADRRSFAIRQCASQNPLPAPAGI